VISEEDLAEEKVCENDEEEEIDELVNQTTNDEDMIWMLVNQ
jgi:hypothetical protein